MNWQIWMVHPVSDLVYKAIEISNTAKINQAMQPKLWQSLYLGKYLNLYYIHTSACRHCMLLHYIKFMFSPLTFEHENGQSSLSERFIRSFFVRGNRNSKHRNNSLFTFDITASLPAASFQSDRVTRSWKMWKIGFPPSKLNRKFLSKETIVCLRLVSLHLFQQ